MLHHRAVIRGWGYSPTLGCEMVKTVVDVGFPWGTEWQDCERVKSAVAEMERRGLRVVVDVRDAG